MSISPGAKFGPYEILSPLGAGGMGEVYRARDTRLGREVAIKVLPQHLTENAEVRARFEREAKTVSSLNHPNICTLFDVGREGNTDYLVMELIEGETLAARLTKGPPPPAETLRIGAEIADALDRAHRAGVVHRDLKPGNIMLTRTGAKLMDFGLARATGLAPGSGSGVTIGALTQSPTVAQPLTAEGTIIGTFQYMAPEQLEGKETDERGDIWALGCVLYEMSTGRRAFDGNSQASLITSIMGSQPAPISQVAPMTPPALDRIVSACLAKDPADRIQSAHDVKLQLAWIAEGGSQAGVPKPVAHRRKSRERLAWVVAAVAVIAAAAVFVSTRPKPVAPPVHAFLQPPRGVLFSSSNDKPLPLAISPDGTTIAFCAREGEGPDKLWVRQLGEENARPLVGTEGAEGPFFSPDGRSLAFYAHRKLRRIDVAGGPVIDLVDQVDPRGGTWNKDDVILFAMGSGVPISMVKADGGAVTTVTALDTTLGEATHRYPHFLPDGKHFLYLARRAGAGKGENPTIFVGELGSEERTPVLELASNVIYASGHLVYVRGTVLVAQRFNPSTRVVEGPAVPLVDDVRMDERFSRGVFAASGNGVLVCMTGNNQTRTQLRWLDRSGKRVGEVGEPADYTYGGTPNISPDGRNAVLAIANRERGTSDVWIVELESGRRRKLTVDTIDHPFAVWLPGGRSVAVTSNDRDNSGIDAVAVDGTWMRRIVPGDDFTWPMSGFGDVLLYSPEPLSYATDIFSVSISGADAEPTPFATAKADEFQPQFSPDGRLVAYVSNETGREDVFVATFPPSGGRWQVSPAGGTQPRWRRDGRELYYMDPENYLVAVEVDAGDAGFQMGAAHRLFQYHAGTGFWRYDVAHDGRFLVTAPLEEDLASPVTLITDWPRIVQSR
ncbi:MAG: protein kinase [Candidatus Krumholzibacteria bacterium]|nr:protein kinase [Candidatus Krumholzibacteria bacterium]